MEGCCLHAHPDDDFPTYWGDRDERGEGGGEGYNRNWPLPQGTDDARYLNALNAALDVIHRFDARYLVLSAGFDVVAGDPIGGFAVTSEGLHAIGNKIGGEKLPTVIVQEGGYAPDALGEHAVAFLEGVAGGIEA